MGGLMVSASLVAPVDAVRFAIAFLVLIVAPGYALATLARPASRWAERLAFAVPCAYSLVAVIGLATALLRLPFDLRTYGMIALPITIAGGYALRTGRGRPRPDDGRSWLVPLGVTVAQVGAVALIFARQVVPSGTDPASHTSWINQIAHTHIFPLAMLSSHAGANDGGFYPPAFHAVTALVVEAIPIPTYHAVFLSVVAIVAILPWALYCYVRAATGCARLAGLSTLASLAFEPLPFFVLAQGLFTFIASLLFVPLLAISLRDGLVDGAKRSVALSALLGIGLFYTHPTEFITVGLLSLAIIPGALLERRNVRSWLRGGISATIVLAAWFVAAFPTLLAVRRTMVSGAQVEVKNMHDFTRPAQVDLPGALNGYLQWVYGHNISVLLLCLALTGGIWCIVRHRYFGLAIAQVILTAVFIDSVSYNVLQRFYVLSFPWALWERLAATHYWFALPLAGIGLDAAIRATGRLWRSRSIAFTAIVATPIIVLGLVLPLSVASLRTAAYARTRTFVAPAELGSLLWLARHAPKRATVIDAADIAPTSAPGETTGADLWLPVVGGPALLAGTGGVGAGTPLGERYLLHHVMDRPLTARTRLYLQRYGVRYILYSPYGLSTRPEEGRPTLQRLLADREFSLTYTSSATCRDVDGRMLGPCPATASYVFTLVPQTSQSAVARNSHVRVAAGRLSSR